AMLKGFTLYMVTLTVLLLTLTSSLGRWVKDYPATCSVYGDPHYITFDGFAYDFNGGCSYVLTTTCGGQSSISNWSKKVSYKELQLPLFIHPGFKHNISVLLPYFTSGTYGQVRAYVDSGYTVLETTFGLRIMMDKQNRLFLQVNEHFKYELCGLCGTYSGQQDDDLVMPGGQNATTTFQFADSWRVQDSNLCVSHPNDPRQCDSQELDQAYNHCYALLGEGFSLCHETLHPEIYISSCVHDFCATRGNLITLCEALKSYAAACAVAGVDLGQWQDGTVCAPSCPANSHYSSCVSACAPTCSHLYGPPGCSKSDCVAGCVCDDGYVLQKRKCVPVQECGCLDLNGKKYDVFLTV
uniref:VWFD domain-containing protein n=1 Tax=Periophthalmus magnuspinnatus TaxID=409849 RepID=A0A3B4AMC4_9GOBI